MMLALIIACALLVLLAAGTTWILILVVRNNEKITAERDDARRELWKVSFELAEAKAVNTAKNDVIMAMEAGAGMLERQHRVALEGLHRIIARLLLKQEGLDEKTILEEQEPEPLRLVESG